MAAEAELHILGVRHHGPGSARMVARALEVLKPDAVLIEGPPDAASVLHHAASEKMVPPVALLVYDPEHPDDASFYPFAEFSPEWQAIRWGLNADADVRFIDLPHTLRPARTRSDGDEPDVDPLSPGSSSDAEDAHASELEANEPPAARVAEDPL